MKESDFSQFDDPCVREVMAAAANLVEACDRGWSTEERLGLLKTALFAAQHSKPRVNECANHGALKPAVGNGDLCQECLDDCPEEFFDSVLNNSNDDPY